MAGKRVGAALVPLLSLMVAGWPAGCAVPSEPEADVFTLESIDGLLPGPYPRFEATLEVTRGTLALRPNGTFEQELRIRCRADLPPATTCTVQEGSPDAVRGTYSIEEGWMEWPTADRFPATFEDGRVTVHLAASAGDSPVGPRYAFVFTR